MFTVIIILYLLSVLLVSFWIKLTCSRPSQYWVVTINSCLLQKTKSLVHISVNIREYSTAILIGQHF